MNDYERLRELAEKATPGPYHIASTMPGKTALCAGPNLALVANRLARSDAEFIAAANPDAIRNLLEDLRLTRQERDQEKRKNMALSKESAALRRGQGRAPEPATPEHTPFHHTHPIPDSTKGE